MEQNKIVEALGRVPVFGQLTQDWLERIAADSIVELFTAGVTIFAEGSRDDRLYVIDSGEVEIVRSADSDQPMVLAVRRAGDFFGEMGLLERTVRSATARALTPVRALIIEGDRLRRLLESDPTVMFRMARVLSSRLRESDLHLIHDLTQANLDLAETNRQLMLAQQALAERVRLERELEIARDLQRAMLPDKFPQTDDYHFAAFNQPARYVGGDLFDVFACEGDRIAVAIADVADKGLAAALFMALLRSLLRAEARRGGTPHEVVTRIHRLLLELGQGATFATLFYGELFPDGVLRYVRAGQDYPLIWRTDLAVPVWLNPPGLFVGMMDEPVFTEAQIKLGPRDVLLLYTDGITDTRSPGGSMYGRDRLVETVHRLAGLQPPDLCWGLQSDIAAFRGDAPLEDDVTFVVAKAAG